MGVRQCSTVQTKSGKHGRIKKTRLERRSKGRSRRLKRSDENSFKRKRTRGWWCNEGKCGSKSVLKKMLCGRRKNGTSKLVSSFKWTYNSTRGHQRIQQ